MGRVRLDLEYYRNKRNKMGEAWTGSGGKVIGGGIV